jgi:phage terminase Nu1 subunit (DNA packaging protein)
MNALNPLDDYVSRDAIAKMFMVAPRTITRWSGLPDGLPHVALGNRTLYRLESVRQWLAGRERRPNQRRPK